MEIKQTLFELLALQTTSDKGENLYKAVDYVESFFKESQLQNIYIRRYEKNGKPSIVISSQDTLSPKVILSGHLDVVPAAEEDAYTPYEKDGKVYARGSSDMKGVDIAMIYAFKELVSINPELNIALMLTTDEEIGGFNGTKYLLEEVGYSADAVFVPDGGGNWNICTEEKGVWHVKIETKGISSHGSRPWLGDNAIEKAIKIFEEIKAQFEAQFGSPTIENSWMTTVNLGVLQGGENTNSVPDSAFMKLDIRHTANVSFDQLEGIISTAVSKYGGEYEGLVYGNPCFTPEGHPITQAWLTSVKKLYPQYLEHSKFVKAHGASDGRFFAAKGIPVLIVKPTCSEIHIAGEWIDYNSLLQFKDLIKEWVVEVGK